jgi:hypothetical protein
VKQTTALLGERAGFLPQLTLQSFYHQCCEVQQQDERVTSRILASNFIGGYFGSFSVDHIETDTPSNFL